MPYGGVLAWRTSNPRDISSVHQLDMGSNSRQPTTRVLEKGRECVGPELYDSLVCEDDRGFSVPRQIFAFSGHKRIVSMGNLLQFDHVTNG